MLLKLTVISVWQIHFWFYYSKHVIPPTPCVMRKNELALTYCRMASFVFAAMHVADNVQLFITKNVLDAISIMNIYTTHIRKIIRDQIKWRNILEWILRKKNLARRNLFSSNKMARALHYFT